MTNFTKRTEVTKADVEGQSSLQKSAAVAGRSETKQLAQPVVKNIVRKQNEFNDSEATD